MVGAGVREGLRLQELNIILDKRDRGGRSMWWKVLSKKTPMSRARHPKWRRLRGLNVSDGIVVGIHGVLYTSRMSPIRAGTSSCARVPAWM